MDRIDDHPEVIIKWLESPEGEYWSRDNHSDVNGILVTIKEDCPDYGIDWFVSVDNEDTMVYLWFTPYDELSLYDA
jgi:hypothetical protein